MDLLSDLSSIIHTCLVLKTQLKTLDIGLKHFIFDKQAYKSEANAHECWAYFEETQFGIYITPWKYRLYFYLPNTTNYKSILWMCCQYIMQRERERERSIIIQQSARFNQTKTPKAHFCECCQVSISAVDAPVGQTSTLVFISHSGSSMRTYTCHLQSRHPSWRSNQNGYSSYGQWQFH